MSEAIASATRLEAGIGHQRRAGVRHQRQRAAPLQPGDELRPQRRRIMFVVGDQRAADAVMGEQHLGDARVFRQDRIDGGERAHRAERDVAEIADRRGDDMQPGLDGLGFHAQSDQGVGGGGARAVARIGRLSHDAIPSRSRPAAASPMWPVMQRNAGVCNAPAPAVDFREKGSIDGGVPRAFGRASGMRGRRRTPRGRAALGIRGAGAALGTRGAALAVLAFDLLPGLRRRRRRAVGRLSPDDERGPVRGVRDAAARRADDGRAGAASRRQPDRRDADRQRSRQGRADSSADAERRAERGRHLASQCGRTRLCRIGLERPVDPGA